MADNVSRVSSVKFVPVENAEISPVSTSQPSSPAAEPASAEPVSGEQADSSAYRLTIESADNGRFVYTVSDPVTGQVVLQLPREVVKDLAKDPDYRGGNLLKTTA